MRCVITTIFGFQLLLIGSFCQIVHIRMFFLCFSHSRCRNSVWKEYFYLPNCQFVCVCCVCVACIECQKKIVWWKQCKHPNETWKIAPHLFIRRGKKLCLCRKIDELYIQWKFQETTSKQWPNNFQEINVYISYSSLPAHNELYSVRWRFYGWIIDKKKTNNQTI